MRVCMHMMERGAFVCVHPEEDIAQTSNVEGRYGEDDVNIILCLAALRMVDVGRDA